MNASDPDLVVSTLNSLFAREGMKRVAVPLKRERFSYEPMQYAAALQNDLWGVAAFRGAPSWTVVKTAPLELLSERAAGAARMRLSDLCRELSVAAFQVNVYDDTATLLSEVSERGDTYVSGCCCAEDPFEWHGERLSEEFIRARFRVLPYQQIVVDERSGDDFALSLSSAFGGKHSEHCDNRTSVAALITHDHPAIEGGVFAYFVWGGPSRVLIPACSWENWRKRKGGPQQGAASDARNERT